MMKPLKCAKQPDDTLCTTQFAGIENCQRGLRQCRPTDIAEQLFVVAGTDHCDLVRLNFIISDNLLFLVLGEGQDTVELSAAGHNLVPKVGALLVLPEIGTVTAADDWYVGNCLSRQ